MSSKTIILEANEVWPLLNILNEVCYGLSIHNFDKTIGTKKEVVINIMDKISNKEESDERLQIELSNAELNVISKSLEVVFKQIDNWEFQTRIGISTQEALKIKHKIDR